MKKFLLALALTFSGTAYATANNDASRAEFPFKNYLADKNPGFENGKAGWTASGGTFTTATSGANFMGIGKASGTWDSNGAGQTLTSSSYTIGNGMAGNNGLFRCKVMTPSGTATHTMGLWDGSSLTNTVSIPSSTTAQYVEIQAPFGAAATTVAIRFTSVNANEPLISIDDCYIGPNVNIGSISQAIFVGESYFAGTASCVWSRASATVGAFSTSATCPGPTVVRSYDGTWATTDVDLPIQTISNLPPGVYEATFQTRVANSAGAAVLAINDGTTTCEAVSTNDDTTFNNGNTVTCTFEYTTAGSHSFQLYGASTGGTINVNNTLASAPRASVKFTLSRFPNSSQMAVRADQSNYDWARFTPSVSAGFGTIASDECYNKKDGHDLLVRCKFTTGTVANTAATLTLPNGLVTASTTYIPNTTILGHWNRDQAAAEGGSILVSAASNFVSFGVAASAANPFTAANVSGILASAQKIVMEFRVPIEGWGENQRAPLLVGSITSNTSATERIERATLNGNCSSTPCAILSQTGAWLVNITRSGTGAYSVNPVAGMFSAAPTCFFQITQGGGVAIQQNSASTSAISITSFLTTTGAAADSTWSVLCMGPR